MADNKYILGKSIIVTGAASGFGKIICEKAAALGAQLTCADIDEESVSAVAAEIRAKGGSAQAVAADVVDAEQMAELASKAAATYGRIDVMINNAGIMPLAFISDHKSALNKWHQCIDVNIKGVLNGMVAVHDKMIEQGSGHIINISSIYGNYPVAGAAVYGASKAAVNFLSESMRMESRGKIKVSSVKPTAVPNTRLAESVINPEAYIGVIGHNGPAYGSIVQNMMQGKMDGEEFDAESIEYAVMEPEYVAEQVLHAINQPAGIDIGDISVRASGDYFVL